MAELSIRSFSHVTPHLTGTNRGDEDMRQSSETDGLRFYLSQLDKFPVLNREDEHRLAARYRDFQDVEAGWILVTSNLRFVIKVSFGYSSYGVRMQDVIQEGNVGLIKAVERFDPLERVPPHILCRMVDQGIYPELLNSLPVTGEDRHHSGATEAILPACGSTRGKRP
jgi:hypothetical protein